MYRGYRKLNKHSLTDTIQTADILQENIVSVDKDNSTVHRANPTRDGKYGSLCDAKVGDIHFGQLGVGERKPKTFRSKQRKYYLARNSLI